MQESENIYPFTILLICYLFSFLFIFINGSFYFITVYMNFQIHLKKTVDMDIIRHGYNICAFDQLCLFWHYFQRADQVRRLTKRSHGNLGDLDDKYIVFIIYYLHICIVSLFWVFYKIISRDFHVFWMIYLT
jgi:hypothetical protein